MKKLPSNNVARWCQPLVIAITVFAALATQAARGDEPDRPRPPNIVMLLADDLGYGDLGCYGQETVATPRLDRMAAEGLRFTQHYSGSTVCAPSRACLLTGRHTGHVFQRANGPIEFRPDPQDRCVAAVLRDAGYATAMIGKSGLACLSDNARLPNLKGFDHFFGYLDHAAAHRYYPTHLWADGKKVEYPGNHGRRGVTYSGDVLLQDALAWIETNRSGPFFLHLALQQPHLDLSVPERWREKYRGRFEETPIAEGFYRAQERPKATFAGMVSYLDDSVGRVLDKLRQLGIAEQTLVLFSSDNGPVNEGGWSHRNFRSGGGLRGAKRDLYEGGIRVPTIAWWPGVIRPGRTTDHVSAFWDFAPTACELAGVPPPEETDGISYAATLRERGEQRRHEALYWEFYERGGAQAVRAGKWKAVRLNVLKDADARIELYDLEQDPAEQNNIAAANPAVVARLATLMQQAHTPTARFRMPPAATGIEIEADGL